MRMRKVWIAVLVLALAVPAAAQITKIKNTAAQLANKTVATIEDAWTITGLWNFSRSPNPPFTVASGSAKVSNLDADFLDGQTDTYYTKWQTVSYTAVGTQNNVDFSLTGSRNAVVMANPASALTITGILAGFDGQRILILNKTASIVIDYANASGSSSAGNKLTNIATSANTPTFTGGFAEFVYDATSTVWRLTAHEQGDFIDYGASTTAVGWSVRTTTNIRYKLQGRSLTLVFVVAGTSNSVNTSFTIPFTAGNITTQYGIFTMQYTDNSVLGATPGGGRILSSTATVDFYKDLAGAAWTAANNKQVSGSFIFQIS